MYTVVLLKQNKSCILVENDGNRAYNINKTFRIFLNVIYCIAPRVPV